ncbi:unnamed protein product, partial [Mesorhabditis belari]|uniref:Uncharacterized protein n=1 Tax=Mesorhabditis belari TaxID=2138241 RepID=A0AAF3FKE5_9BILA
MNARNFLLCLFFALFALLTSAYPYEAQSNNLLGQRESKRFRGEPIRFGKRSPREPIRFGKRAAGIDEIEDYLSQL